MLATTCVVALPIPAAAPYRYAIPQALVDRVQPGARVVVPVRSRDMVGVVVELDDTPVEGLKSVLLAPDDAPLLPAKLLDLGGWVSGYYATPIGLTFKAMLPSALWGSSRLIAEIRNVDVAAGGVSRDVLRALEQLGGRAPAGTLARKLNRPVWDALQRLARLGAVALETEAPDLGPRVRTQRIVVLTKSLPSLLERDRMFGRARRQRAVYEALDALGGQAPADHLRHQLGFSAAVQRALVERGLAEFQLAERLRDPFGGFPRTMPVVPTTEQRAAADAIRALPAGGTATLFGVTGSGKTLVYLEALREAVDRGEGAIVLVPEIALTPQTISRVRGAFGETVAVLHSGLSDGERADAWRGLASGLWRVAVGARSAVFAPIAGVAALVVDEEHDASYKHGEAPRYHARDVARRRAALEGARVVLGSATPSLETWALQPRVPLITLPNRVTAQPLPRVSLIDLRSEPCVKDSGAIPWSQALDEAVATELTSARQIILLLNRRGFAHFLQCGGCGHVWECPHCSVSFTVHHTPHRLRCHYCGTERRAPAACDECGDVVHDTRGIGTQQLEQWLAARYPSARLARMDADTTSAKWSHQRILDAVAEGDIDILLGTQMIAKGLDFPGVTLVGVVDADTGLHLPDFRAAERTFQLIAQVAGRAGRGPNGGRVLVQTRSPTHYALEAAAHHDVERFAARELDVRRSPPYPPHTALVNVVLSGRDETMVADAAVEVADWLRGLVRTRTGGAVEVVGPAPAPLARIKTRWRWHIVLRSAERRWIDRVARYAAYRAPHTGRGHIRVAFDRDPVSLL